MNSSIDAVTSVATEWLSRLVAATGEAEQVRAADPQTTAAITGEDLLLRATSGDRDALELLIARYAQAVYSCIRHRVRNRDTADDLFQETWIRVIERCHTYRAGNAVLPWLYRIAINVVTDNARRGYSQRRGGAFAHVAISDAHGLSAPNSPADEVLMQNQERALLHRAVLSLPEPYGEVVRLRYFEELPVADVAQVLGCAEGTVKSRLSRGLGLLQKCLEDSK